MSRPQPGPGASPSSPPPPTPPPTSPPRRRRNIPLLLVGLVALVIAAVVVIVINRDDDGTPPPAAGGVRGAVQITAADGVQLGAVVTEPAGGGRHPLVVMPASYSASSAEYVVVAKNLTAAGFVTVSYTQRGFLDSGGTVDLAGDKTRRDARTVIDWALQNTAADPDRIGMLGASYGAGISLLAAAQDRRIRAVVALSTWTDFAVNFRPGNTINALGLGGLLTVQRADPQLTALALQLRGNPVGTGPLFESFVRPRSPASYVAELNRNKPAIMIANGWQDSLLSPAQLVPFYDQLTTPKRLLLTKGDHVGPEAALLTGKQSLLGDTAYAWLKHYLQGADNGVQRQQPVQLQDVTTGKVQGYSRWPTPKTTSLSLGAPSTRAVALGSSPSTWSSSIGVGEDSGAKIGNSQFGGAQNYRIPTVRLSELPSSSAFVWAAGPVGRATRVLGSVRYSLSAASNAPAVSLFAYLYDFAPDRTGSLLAMTPYTATGANSGGAAVSAQFEPIDWTLQSGHQLGLVIDTVEPWWLQVAPKGSQLTVSSTTARPATLSVPLT